MCIIIFKKWHRSCFSLNLYNFGYRFSFDYSIWDYYIRWIPLSPQYGASSGYRSRDCHQLWRVVANAMNKQQQTNEKG
jgi:hypothetical protein